MLWNPASLGQAIGISYSKKPGMLTKQLGGKNRTTAAISVLLESVLRGEFQIGDHLTESFLSEKLGINRTPVREVLPKLKGLGIV